VRMCQLGALFVQGPDDLHHRVTGSSMVNEQFQPRFHDLDLFETSLMLLPHLPFCFICKNTKISLNLIRNFLNCLTKRIILTECFFS
jgi:hypothetical protein